MSNKIYIADLTHTGNGTMALTFPLGASYVASYAKKILGDKYDFKLFKYQDRLHKAFLEESPLVLGLSNYCWNIELGYKLIRSNIISPSSLDVFALKFLQKSIMFTPWGPSAVPTGGAGVALPAGI